MVLCQDLFYYPVELGHLTFHVLNQLKLISRSVKIMVFTGNTEINITVYVVCEEAYTCFQGENETAPTWFFLLLKGIVWPLARRFWPPFLSPQKAQTRNSTGKPKWFQVKKPWSGSHLSCSWELLTAWAQGTSADFLPALNFYDPLSSCFTEDSCRLILSICGQEGQSKVKHIWTQFCLIILPCKCTSLIEIWVLSLPLFRLIKIFQFNLDNICWMTKSFETR